ncbi:MAG: two-component system NtrC family response regulator [Halioglobus sp.]|jgi:two-component system NtrC family response regulator
MDKATKYLLVVEDDKGVQGQLRWAFDGYEVLIADDREQAITQLRRMQPGVVLLDLGLPPDPGGVTEGLATLKEILTLAPETRVIIVTGDNDRANAVTAISLGAYDFYQKPIEGDILGFMVDRAYRVFELEKENLRLQQYQRSSPLSGIIAGSPSMLAVCKEVERLAPVEITVLLLGASGTGKERFAQAIHSLSPRRDEKMVAINCAAIPDTLLESELFGYEKGAFTGATQQTIGKLEYADGGTLFLDEIGDLPLDLQAKLLRFLQERVVERLGGRKEIPVDVRIICATHQDLAERMADGRFREDLFYRISEISVEIPPLCDRDGDALMLARVFLDRFSSELRRPLKGFDRAAIEAIEAYQWPGNVRELESRVKRATIMADGYYITAQDMNLAESNEQGVPLNLRKVKEDIERKAVLRALAYCEYNVSEAASLLGIARPTIYKLMDKYQLKEETTNDDVE